MLLKLPTEVLHCIKRLESGGFECWCVGGAVRDGIMGLVPEDYDIATNALPEQTEKLFPHTVLTGAAHGTVTAVIDGMNIEITTYRSDGTYSDRRRPDGVTFISSVDEDLKRRDFTVNSICYNPAKGIYDPMRGVADIENRIIRCIGEPDKRFGEDALRILRAFRFSAQLDFDVDAKTRESALKLSGLLNGVSVERIFMELKKGLVSKNPRRMSDLFDSHALGFLGFPRHTVLDGLEGMPADLSLRFAVMCENSGADAEGILKKLRSDNHTVKQTSDYSKMIKADLPRDRYALKKFLCSFGIDSVKSYLEYKNDGEALRLLNGILDRAEPYCLKMLAVTGDDLIQHGICGAQVGETLEFLLDTVMKHPEYNDKGRLLGLIKK